ncbi:amino acid--[acyl-carrier-protein] ligase [Rhodococcus pyridinivorans]|uniref:amino acid--[acyl-carrier-protein] ligase n=1 Tax=Rhodococcus pyridinivorans TaxID=103816 RepID=UPI002284BBAF|nr:amino acid--[acyl-carrier-protein] ligase [Rhodococcus pyridinivorans]WAL46230.1 amino acid--[acyl-carrier-protein] ligase [Rhodococcus pyridinivorans]
MTSTAITSAASDELSELERARLDFQQQLLEAELLVETGVPGLYGRSGVFEDIVDGIDRVVVAAGPGRAATRLRFPPVFPRTSFERTDYIASFPHLTGAVNTFAGSNAEHAELLAARSRGEAWDPWLEPADTVLVSAACHPAYSRYTGTLREGGELLDVLGYCFRHEPAVDPARMQAFRMHEFVRIGTENDAAQHRDSWVERGLEVLGSLGLDATAVPANDPFFGRAGRMLAVNQRTENLKTELTVRLYGDLDDGTAVVSCNCHREHFGETFEIRTADGEVAHSACVGFGMERIALGLLRTHGLDVDRWPASVRDRLFP